MSWNRNYPENYNERRSGGSWDRSHNDNNERRNNFRNEDEDYSSAGNDYYNFSRDSRRDDDENRRYRSQIRNERRQRDPEDNEFGYTGDPYPEYKYTRGMWGPAGYGIAMGNYEGRPHYAQSGREYISSGRKYISRAELEERENKYNRNRNSDNDRNWNRDYDNDRFENRDRDWDRDRNRNRRRDEDDKNVFERMGEGIRGAWNDATGESYRNDDRNRYSDRDRENYRNRENRDYRNDRDTPDEFYENPYMRKTPEGYGNRGSSQYGTQRMDRGRGYSSRENLNMRHSYNRDNNDWEY